MKKFTKILVILLSVALVCACLAVAISADGSNGQASYTDAGGSTVTASLADALANVPAGGTVTLEGDCTILATVKVNKSFSVNLNGYKLTTTAAAFVIEANDITFTICGTGSMQLGNRLVGTTASYKGFTVNVKGDEGSAGISVNHTGSNIINTTHGTWNFANLNVVSTSVIDQATSYFMTERAADSSAKLSFNNVIFDNRSVPFQAGSGNKVVAISGSGSVSILNSAFYTQNSGIYAANANGAGKVTGNIDIENSIISCLGNPVGNGGRNYVVFGMHHSFGTESNGFNGTINVKNSHVECNVRMFTCGNNDVFTLNIDGSTIKIAGNTGTDGAYGFTRGKATVSVTNNSRVLFSDANVSVKVPEGTRTNRTGAVTPADGCTLVYDPVGDPEAPYVVVKAASATVPDYYKNYSFDLVRFTTNTPGERLLVTNQTKQSGWNSSENFFNDLGGIQWDIKAGKLTHIQAPTNNYVRYYIEDDDGLDYTTKRRLTVDPYFVMGLDMHGQYEQNGNVHVSAINGDNRKKVMVSEVDFATDSAVGYPKFNVASCARDQSNLNFSGASLFEINPDGTIKCLALKDHQSSVTLNPAGMWNRLSMVCITDPVNSKAIVYLYLNGEYMGYGDATNGNAATYHYFQGIRFNIPNNTDYNVGASLCFDNVSFRCYADYRFAGETDYVAATDSTEEVEAVYYPERYIVGSPAHKYVSETYVNSNHNTVSEALANATANGTDLDLTADIKAPQLIKTNGIISTNGYTLNVDPASYGCTVSYDANGNAVYTFNEATDNSIYNGTVKYHFYVGGDFDNYSDNAYKTVNATVDQAPSCEINAIYGNFTNNGKNLSVNYQLGWDNSLIVTPEALDKGEIYVYPTFSVSEKTVTNGYVKNANGRILSLQFTEDEARSAYNGIQDGETFVLLANLTLNGNMNFYSHTQTKTVDGNKYVNGVKITNSHVLDENGLRITEGTEYTEEELAKMKEVAQVLSIDYNGYDVHNNGGQLVAAIGCNTVLNLYSSNPGTEISAWNHNGTAMWAGRVFAIGDNGASEGLSQSLRTFNAYLNIGSSDSCKLTVMGEALAEGLAGDNSCTITVDNVIYGSVVSAGGSHSAFARYYDGNIIIKNSLLYAPLGESIVSINKYDNTDFTPYFLFDNCLLIKNGEFDNITNSNGKGNGTQIEFVNCTVSGRLNNSDDQRNKFGYGNAASALHPDSTPWLADSNLTRAYYNQPMTMDGYLEDDANYIKFVAPTFVAANGDSAAYIDTSKYFYVANYGCGSEISGMSDAKSKTVLPLLTEKLVYKSETVKVTWKDASGATVTTQTYVKGADVLAQAMSSDRKAKAPISAGAAPTLNSLNVTVEGWNALPTNIQANTTITPKVTVTSKLDNSSVKTNLTLTSDFTINIYIPAELNEYMTVKNGNVTLDKTVVDLGTEEAPANYVQAVIAKACDKVAEKAVFEIVLSEGGYSASVTLSISILDYANAILSSGAYGVENNALMYYMLTYAREAVEYFNDETEADVAATLSLIETVMNKYTGKTVDIDTSYGEAVNTGLEGALVSASVKLEATPAFVFTLMDNFVGTVTITDGANTRTYTFAEGNTNTALIHEVKVYNFAEVYNITVSGSATVDGETVNINAQGKYNLASFAAYHVGNAATATSSAAASAACNDLVKALYEYARIASWYMRGTLAEKLA
ncbi:MAG: hypothetical protein IKD45_04565 [Clostridia bacterium]|nr:hypothetical protein [Clostridia bacterium]